MRVVVQRSLLSSVKADGNLTGKIDKGFVVLVGFCTTDDFDTVKKMVEKIVNLRVFEDENGKMNLDIKSVNGKILSVSQFTLYAKLNGRRPSFSGALNYLEAKELYGLFNEEMKKQGLEVQTGIFGSNMEVNIINDGPVTIIIDSAEDL